MIAALALLIVLAGTVANVHYFGVVAGEQRTERAELDLERVRLTGWARRLVVHETRTIGCKTSAECARNLHALHTAHVELYDQQAEQLAGALATVGKIDEAAE